LFTDQSHRFWFIIYYRMAHVW